MPDIATAHDAHLSLWQSAVDAAAVAEKQATPTDETPHPAAVATAAVVESKDPCVDCEKNGLPHHDGELATLSAAHFQLAEAEAAQNPIDQRIAERIIATSGLHDAPAGSIFRTAVGMFKVFVGKLNRPVYRNWKEEGGGNIGYSTIEWRVPARGRVAILSDWGTGYADAEAVLRAACAFDPDAILHLGDIYFAGTEFECRLKFLDPMRRYAFKGGPGGEPIPVFTTAGNHDYYSGGAGFHWLLDNLNEGAQRQPASYFSLRSEDDGWQFLAVDTGFDSRHDVIYSHQFGSIPQPDEVEWMAHKFDTFPGRTVLLSHHQAFSNLSRMGGDEDDRKPPFDAVNKRLLAIVEPYVEKIAAWFWGHEHNLMVYKPWNGIRARSVGHSARPVKVRQIEEEASYAYAVEEARLSERGESGYLNHGFEIIDLGGRGNPAQVSYYEVLESGMPRLVYREEVA